MSVSVSRMPAILTIAAAADCTWPYSSESSWSGWNSRPSRPMNAITVPSVALPSWTRSAPTHSTAPVASMPSHSMAGKNTAQIVCAWTFAAWFASFISLNASRNWSARG